MRLVTISLILLALTACGPSQGDINNTATITCNIMAESRNMDGAMRIKEINAAREKIGADPYLGTDATIKESLQLGLCTELIKDDPSYPALARDKIEALRLEEERLAALRLKEMEAQREEQARQEAMSVLEEFNKDPYSYFRDAVYVTHTSAPAQILGLSRKPRQEPLDIPIATIKVSLLGHTLEAPFQIYEVEPQWDIRGEKFDNLRAELEKLPIRNTNPSGLIYREIPMSEITFSADLK